MNRRSGVAALALDGRRDRHRVAPHRLIVPALANAVVLVSGYMAIATLIWSFADASMDQPLELVAFEPAPSGGRTWRIAHLADLHVVGEQYGFRIERTDVAAPVEMLAWGGS